MSDRMKPLSFERLLDRVFLEQEREGSVFGIPSRRFFRCPSPESPSSRHSLFGRPVDIPIGPAAGPHTQLAQNIVCAFLTGGRYIELKTVQQKDDLTIEKPCIQVPDEGYNTEWSQELSLARSAEEYIKAWVLIHLLDASLGLSASGTSPGVLFNMSVGYDLEGISGRTMQRFLGRMLDPREEIQGLLQSAVHRFPRLPLPRVPSEMVHSVTISTMHGCPPSQIAEMARFLIQEKGLHTWVKLNPTLLGKEKTRRILQELGYDYLQIEDSSFDNDLQYPDAVELIRNLIGCARGSGRRFGIKLSNTLPCRNPAVPLPGHERYLSGRALFPITINLARELAEEFNGKISISFSGGASVLNTREILSTGIFPVTMTTDLLKPGGYLRLLQTADGICRPRGLPTLHDGEVDPVRLDALAESALSDPLYRKEPEKTSPVKLTSTLHHFDCITAPCVQTCPIHQDIPDYLDALEEADPARALSIILKKNPLPGITGFICDHTCMDRCVRRDYDNPIAIRDLKRTAFERGDRNEAAAMLRHHRGRGKRATRVAVLGGGPAGLAVSSFLAREGFSVRIFERTERAGGTVRAVIPRFRLPDSVIEEDLRLVKASGVEIFTGWNGEFSIDSLKSEGFAYVVLATGSASPKRLRIGADGAGEGYYTGIDFLRRLKGGERLVVGERVAVIGGGNSAVDAARAALRFRPEQVSIIYRRDLASMPADREEVQACLEEGIRILQLLSPRELVLESGRIRGVKCTRVRLGSPDETGRPRPVPVRGSVELIEADTVIAAVGEEVEADILKKNGIPLNRTGGVLVDGKTGETRVRNIYAAGDCVRGPATVVQAIADARNVALAIMRREKLDTPESLTATYYRDETKQRRERCEDRHGAVTPFFPVKKLPPDRRGVFETVIQPLDERDAARESMRCLRCSTICNRCVETCPNRANVALFFTPVRLGLTLPAAGHGHEKMGPVDGQTGSGHGQTADSVAGLEGDTVARPLFEIVQSTQILHIDDFCNECGNCETFCPHQGAPFRDKLTLFSDRTLFERSSNSGFFPLSSKNGRISRFGCRVGDAGIGGSRVFGDDTGVKRIGSAGSATGRFDLELGSEPGTFRFFSGDRALLLEPDGAQTALTMRCGPFEGGGKDGLPDTASLTAMVGLALIIRVVIDRYPYLLA